MTLVSTSARQSMMLYRPLNPDHLSLHLFHLTEPLHSLKIMVNVRPWIEKNEMKFKAKISCSFKKK